ncbi:MAG: sugar phosphate isomerase/epimerase family protein [Burkholderiales bacterium]
MYKIKQSLDAVNYGAYFYDGRPLTMEEIVQRAADFGYEAVDIWPYRPVGFPLDFSKDAKKRLLDFAKSRNIKFATIDLSSNFMRTDHALVPKLDKELLYVKECCEFAKDLEVPVIRILPAFIGYFYHEYWNMGYGNTAMHSRTLEVSQLKDYLVEWEAVRSGIIEAAKIASDYDVQLAVQGHPPIINCVQDMIDMVEEINMPNVKMGVDLPLFDRQDDEYVYNMVKKIGKRMIHSHTLGVINKTGPGGMIYASEEVVPGDGIENWLPFFRACRDIGYEGYFAYEQCAPFLMPGHKLPGIEEIDRRQKAGFEFIKSFEQKL